MDSYEQDMMEKFQREGLKQLLKEYFQITSEQKYNRVYDNEIDIMAKDLIAHNGNIVICYAERYGDGCDNFSLVELAEVYRKWKNENERIEK